MVAGGTDVMVAANDGRLTPAGWISLRRIAELRSVEGSPASGWHIGAGVSHATLCARSDLPALAAAARTVGGPQIRAAGTIGGNVMTASPAGDTLPVLLCLDAEVELRSATSTRRLALAEFLLGPKRTARHPGELLTAVHLPPAGGAQAFAKLGPRSAMAIAVCSLAVRADPAAGVARVAIGASAPTARRCPTAEAALLAGADAAAFAEAVRADADPIDDHRATAAYRRHALGVLARRLHARVTGEAR